MSIGTERRKELIKRCRDLESRFTRLANTGMDCSIGIMWAKQWADSMMDTRGIDSMYSNWIEQQEKRANKLEARAGICRCAYVATSGTGMGYVLYRCTNCGDEYEKDVS